MNRTAIFIGYCVLAVAALSLTSISGHVRVLLPAVWIILIVVGAFVLIRLRQKPDAKIDYGKRYQRNRLLGWFILGCGVVYTLANVRHLTWLNIVGLAVSVALGTACLHVAKKLKSAQHS